MTIQEIPKNVIEVPFVSNLNQNSKEKSKYPTIDEIRLAIPKYCFEKNLLISMAYVMKDYLQIIIWYFCFPVIEKYFGLPGLILYYWFFGMLSFALFVSGHECGHGTFSKYKWINDIFGHICHSPLMVPYWPWQKSHNRHHQFTSHIDKDMGHAWITEENHFSMNFFLRHWQKPIIVTGFILWLPIYLILGYADGSHYWPMSKLYVNNTERIQCAVSSLSCMFCATIAYHFCNYEIFTWIKYFWIPVFMMGFWLTMVTYLQHREDDIEVYEEGTWNYVRGQLQTIDRIYGFGMESICHHITDGHLVHHLFFRQIPHYHLMEATAAIKKFLEKYDGNLYRQKDSRDFLWQYMTLNVKLEYLRNIGNGILRFAGYENKKES